MSLPAFAVAQLRQHRAAQAARRLAIGPGWIDLDLVCDRGDGGPLHPDSFSRAFKRLAKAAGISSKARLHDARHAVAPTLMTQGYTRRSRRRLSATPAPPSP